MRTGCAATGLSRDGATRSYRLVAGTEELTADAVVVTTPARASAGLIEPLDPEAGTMLRAWDHASVVMVTLRTTETDLAPFAGLSGYLVPKPAQDRLTAVSFGSNKWSHWKPADGSMILRASMGRDGAPVDDLIQNWSDERFVRQAVDEVACHTGVTLTPAEYRVTRWPQSFPQYRPGHAKLVETLDRSLANAAPGVVMAGASMRGIGIPACVAQAGQAATVTQRHLISVL
ncbi:MAG: protoporphyrinogen oxidase [Ilumatobacteraceae bacterium]